MPEYLFRNKETSTEWKEYMSISECDTFLQTNPNIEQLFYGSPAIADSKRVGIRAKPDSGFRDLLKNMKKKSGKRSTINTF